MTKRLKPKLHNKFITRLSVKTNLLRNPEQFGPPLATYFDKIGPENMILNGEHATNNFRQTNMTQQQKGERSKTHISNHLDPFRSVYTQHRDQDRQSSSVFNNTRIQKNKTEKTQSPQRQVDQTNIKNTFIDFIKIQIEKINDPEPKYMSYSQYEEIIQNKMVKPSHFEGLAKKNDQKLLQISQSKTYVDKKIVKEVRDIFDMTNHQYLQMASKNKNKKNRTQGSEIISQFQAQKIISSDLGALSNVKIRHILQEKWEQEQKNQLLKPVSFSEDSQGGSQRDPRQLTVREGFKSLQKKPNKKQDSNRVIEQKSEICRIKHVGHRKKLAKILEIDTDNATNVQQGQQFYSNGDQYSEYERGMIKFKDIYRIKKFELKHKLDWKL